MYYGVRKFWKTKKNSMKNSKKLWQLLKSLETVNRFGKLRGKFWKTLKNFGKQWKAMRKSVCKIHWEILEYSVKPSEKL